MRINLFKADVLEEQINLVKSKLHLPNDVTLELALDSVHGINELTRSLAHLHPHKKSIAILGAQPPLLQQLVAGFAADGFSIQILPVSITNPNPVALREAFDKLKKDTLFVLGCAIEPLTASFYPFDFIRSEAPKRSIFSVIYLSPDALKRGLTVPATPWEGIVADPLWNDTHTLTLVLKGERCQGESLFWGKPHFSDQAVLYLATSLERICSEDGRTETESPEDKDLVRGFEEEICDRLGSSVQVLSLETPRLFDRAVMFIDGIHGDSLASTLQKIGLEAFSGAACGWNDPHLNNWLPHLGVSSEKVQSSILIPVKTLRVKQFPEKFLAIVSNLRNISGFISSD